MSKSVALKSVLMSKHASRQGDKYRIQKTEQAGLSSRPPSLEERTLKAINAGSAGKSWQDKAAGLILNNVVVDQHI